MVAPPNKYIFAAILPRRIGAGISFRIKQLFLLFSLSVFKTVIYYIFTLFVRFCIEVGSNSNSKILNIYAYNFCEISIINNNPIPSTIYSSFRSIQIMLNYMSKNTH